MTRPAPDPARVSARAAFESFLVEDVILTLGNLRGSLAWVMKDSAAERACFDRLDRQIALLQDRARQMARWLCEEVSPPEPTNLFAVRESDMRRESAVPDDIDISILSVLAAPDEHTPAPVFRSRRG